MKIVAAFSVAMLVASIGTAAAQDSQASGEQNPPHKSAPAQSSHAPGHDVQAGAPGTGEKTSGEAGSATTTGTSTDHDNKQIRDEAEKQQKK